MTIFVQELNLGGPGRRVAVKDSLDIAGYPTRAGCQALDGAPAAARHADVVQRVLDAGCHIVGKANLHELAFGVTGINGWTGTPPNPKYPGLIPGGSSSGSAAAVAAGLADFALGTDTGGSIRIPAACCGVYGLKPTYGRVSRRGAAPAVSSLDCVGAFAADAATLAEAMAIIDPTFETEVRFSGRVAMVEADGDPAIAACVRGALETAGLRISTERLPLFEEAFQAGLAIINAETWAAFGHLVSTGKVGADVAARLTRARDTSAADISHAETIRAAFTEAVDAALKGVDALALPTMPDYPVTVDDALADRSGVRMTAFVRPFNLSGHPALSLPLPAQDNRPAALQLVGRKGDDALLCRLAQHIAQRLDQ